MHWLRDAVLRVPDPSTSLDRASRLLGGERGDGRLLLASGTTIAFTGGAPGFVTATLQTDGNGGEHRDADGRSFTLEPVGDLKTPLDVPGSRLGHLTFVTPEPLAAAESFTSVGFRTSEGLGDVFRWLRCNPIHHTVAFSKASRPGLHHVGIELPDRRALVDACDRLADEGQPIEYGPGRHLVGHNLFAYFRDPDGIRWELFCELERVEQEDRAPLIHDLGPGSSVNVWGPQPPETYREALA